MSNLVIEPIAGYVFRSPWISAPGAANRRNCVFRLVKTIELTELPETAILRITADTHYVLYINGQQVGRGPIRGSIGVQYFDTWDIGALLKPGRNVFAVLVLAHQCDNFTVHSVTPAVRLEAEGIIAGGCDWHARIAPDWRPVEWKYTRITGFMEWRLLSEEPVGWLNGDCSGWAPAVVADSPGLIAKRLLPRGIPALRRTEYFPADLRVAASVSPGFETEPDHIALRINQEHHEPPSPGRLISVPVPDGGSGRFPLVIQPDVSGKGVALVFDFDRELLGQLEVILEAPAQTVAEITYGEELWHGRIQAFFPDQDYYFTDRYDLREGTNRIGTLLTERGFKMVQITLRNFSRPVTISGMRAVDFRYPFTRYGRFFCSDPRLNAIYNVCVETLATCTSDVFIDCPWRERSFWINDFVVENRTSLAVFGASAVHRRAFELAFSQTRKDGLIPGVCPSMFGADGQLTYILVPTNMFIILMLYEYAMASADFDTVRKHMPDITRILDEFERWADSDGLITSPETFWEFYDWSFELNGYNFNEQRESMLNSLYVLGMKLTLKLGEEAEYELDRADYSRRIERTTAAIVSHFYSAKQGCLIDPVRYHGTAGYEISSQLAHSIALLSGVVPEKWKATFHHALLDEKLLRPDFYMHRFIFNSLLEAKMPDEAMRRIRKYWGNAVSSGHPTLYEAGIHEFGREAFSNTGSLCHGFGTAPIEFFERAILGITALTPGFKRFLVAPHAFDLEFAEGRVVTPAGNIHVKWRRNQEGLCLELLVPDGCIAEMPSSRTYAAGEHCIQIMN